MIIAIPISKSKVQYYINQAYIDYINDAGFTPLLISQGAKPAELMKRADGLLLPGGIDIDPIYYGEDNYTSYGSDPEKDSFERELLYMALEKGVPIFGICRGFQLIVREYILMNKKASQIMSFWQHIQSHSQTETQQLVRTIPQHFVNFLPHYMYDGKLDVADVKTMPVNSMHHQCLMTSGPVEIENNGVTFTVVAWTDRGVPQKEAHGTCVCEAVCLSGMKSKILAVQWHPEELSDVRLLKGFFKGEAKCRTTSV